MNRPDPIIAAHLAKVACLYRWETGGRWSYCIHDKICPGCITHDVGHAEMTADAGQYKLLELAYRIKTEEGLL